MGSLYENFNTPVFDASLAPPPDATIKTAYHLVNFNARKNAYHEFCLQAEKLPGSDQISLVSITHSDFERAIVACQSWILGNIASTRYSGGDGTSLNKPVALLIESDVSILIYMWALFGLGVPVLLLSIRLSPEALRHLLSEVKAQSIIASPRLQGLANEVVSGWYFENPEPAIYLRESYQFFLNSTTTESSSPPHSNAWPKSSYGGDSDRDVLILHSSGTTGLPKPIRQSHRYILNYGQCHDSPDQKTAVGRTVSTLPLFHGFGLLAPLLSLTIGKTFVIPPPNVIPSATIVTALLKSSSARSLITVPSIIEEIHNLPNNEGTGILSKLDFVGCGGGMLKPNLGNTLARSGAKIVNSYGCTEAGPLSVMYKPGEDHDWRYFKLRPDMPIQIHHALDPTPQIRLTVKIPGWDDEFELQDFFEQSHEQANRKGIYLRPLERTDSVIVLKNGEKVSPYVLESLLSARDDIKGALVVGTGYFQLGLIIEPTEAAKKIPTDEFKTLIWETITQASLSIDAHARITSPDAIVVLKGDEEMKRSDKGAILPRDTMKKYDNEIKDMYSRLEGLGDSSSQINLFEGDIETNLKNLLMGHVWRPEQTKDQVSTEDLFELGMDSLQSVQLRRLIFSSVAASEGVKVAEQLVPGTFIYANPSLSKMAEKLRNRCSEKISIQSRDQILAEYLREHGNFESVEEETGPNSETNLGTGAVVLLTGSTGQLGTHILSILIQNKSVDSIICLNRPSSFQDGYARQVQCSELKGAPFPLSVQDPKVKFIETKTNRLMFGLEPSDFRSLASSVTHIIHAAWPMDFNRHLPSFTSQFKIIKDLASLPRYRKSLPGQNDFAVRFLFVSSISVIGSHSNAKLGKPIPEESFNSFDNTVGLGYAEAKLVCENLVQKFTEQNLFQGSVVRMGQIAGSKKNGFWNAEEHFPTMIKASMSIGALPELSNSFSWIPVEDAAATVVDILFSKDKTFRQVYHVENPIRQPWGTVLNIASSKFRLPIKPYKEWLELLRAHYAEGNENSKVDGQDKETYSVVALLEFFENVFPTMSDRGLVMSTQHAQLASSSLAACGAVPEDLIQKYLDAWVAAEKAGHPLPARASDEKGKKGDDDLNN
ncbi:acetyl-CoA synthetase-like protein [Periconia macrospinosa]|uniref:Acetyl-CoA synthetase-like protein n=1 Tax=Periconia macrospinosa TaxID=97972 RepID=A0A2V1DXH1_9PLEO|nr:acetyl-CoA synthetase-like protein [Periconia macrospinosa]